MAYTIVFFDQTFMVFTTSEYLYLCGLFLDRPLLLCTGRSSASVLLTTAIFVRHRAAGSVQSTGYSGGNIE